ncbi:MAG: hypothetical protein HY816_16370 [Candidatus Wallbacteria bacterium]|nr:hypothetical protein [Candidatus Wallbacteria bacterium]
MYSSSQTVSAGACELPADAGRRPGERSAEARAEARRMMVIVNRSALRTGGGLLERLRRRWADAEFVEPQDAEALLRTSVGRFGQVTIAGGDGTLCRLLGAVLEADATVRLVPCGTANDLAAELGVPRGRRALALDGEELEEKPIDVLVAGDAPFTTVGFLGFGSDVVRIVNQLRAVERARPFLAMVGSLVYVLGVLWIGFLRRLELYRLRIVSERGTFEVETPLVVACNQPRVGGTMTLAAGTANDDGHFRLLVFRQHSGWHLLRAIFALCRGVAPAAAGVESFETQDVELASTDGRPFMFCADGEELVFDSQMRLSVHERRLRVLVPKS